MEGIGRGLAFETVYEGCATLLRHVFFRPVVLIFECTEEGLLLTAYCGRDIFAISSMNRALRLFVNGMPKGLSAEMKEPLWSRLKNRKQEP